MFLPRNTFLSDAFAFLRTLTKRTACFGALQLKMWTTVGFCRLLFLLLFGTVCVGKKFTL